ncbi:MAG: hypothetical protein ACLUKK_08465 [Lacrimispora saccharolytica]
MRKSLKALAAAAAVFLTACGSSTGGAAAPPGTASVQAETREQEQTKQEQTKQEQGEVTGSSEEEGAEIIGGADGPTAIFIAPEADSAQEIENYPSLREMAGDTQIDPDGEGKVFLDSVRSDGVYVLEEGGEWSPRTDQMGTAVIHGPFGVILLRHREDGSWLAERSVDMAEMESSYMESGDNTEVLPAGGAVFISVRERGSITAMYELVMENGQLFQFDVSAIGRDEAESLLLAIRQVNEKSGIKFAEKGKGSEPEPEGKTAMKIYDSAMTADGTEVFLCADGPALTDFCLMWKDRETGGYVTEPVVWEE